MKHTHNLPLLIPIAIALWIAAIVVWKYAKKILDFDNRVTEALAPPRWQWLITWGIPMDSEFWIIRNKISAVTLALMGVLLMVLYFVCLLVPFYD